MKAPALLLLLAFTAACSTSSDAPPMPREQFQQVLAATLLVEAKLNHQGVAQRVGSPDVTTLTDSLFAAHGTDRATFQRTYDHYLALPQELRDIYEETLNILQLQADSLSVKNKEAAVLEEP